MEDLYTIEGVWSGADVGATTVDEPVEVLAERLAALPTEQLEAFSRTIERCRAGAPALMGWLRALVQWERARRIGRTARPAVPRFAPREQLEAVFALSALAAQFRSNPENFPAPVTGPLGQLFEAARNTLEHGTRRASVRLH